MRRRRDRPSRRDLSARAHRLGLRQADALATDGHLPFPFGRELTGYEVADLTATLDKAKAAGAKVLVEPFRADGRDAAMVQFPGGYIAEIHSVSPR